ncbi:MAG: hypothetical protein M1823_000472 [Watsoniomyces obsoletus]|nr:MAG: hypothetical protein M1823_000472 [Watsoniomyces obsoletus]
MDVSSQESVSDNEQLVTKATPAAIPANIDEGNIDVPSDEEDNVMPIRTRTTPKATVEDDVDDEDSVMKDADDVEKSTGEDNGAEDENDDEDDVADGEYIVEKILNHQFDDNGVCFYLVKWKGYEKKSDQTWEPIANLEEGAAEILKEYHRSIGGKPIYREKKALRTSRTGKTATPSSTGGIRKSGKGSIRAPSSSASVSKSRRAPAKSTPAWTAPKGSWEDHIQAVDTIEQEPEGLFVYLQWNDGRKSRHPMDQIYVKCPMKMLYFYEQHLVFKEGGSHAASVSNTSD